MSARPTLNSFDRGDWIGLAVFVAPIAVATLHWLVSL